MSSENKRRQDLVWFLSALDNPLKKELLVRGYVEETRLNPNGGWVGFVQGRTKSLSCTVGCKLLLVIKCKESQGFPRRALHGRVLYTSARRIFTIQE
jgi:hypothetical protein